MDQLSPIAQPSPLKETFKIPAKTPANLSQIAKENQEAYIKFIQNGFIKQPLHLAEDFQIIGQKLQDLAR